MNLEENIYVPEENTEENIDESIPRQPFDMRAG